ncbi:MAG: protein kinase [Verrucomicrobia bacterium]|nr:protein kinase [Verrucomicrobiota bacterium]
MKEKLPDKIDHYLILKSLGKGGMGEVFLASDPQCKRQVALKQIRSELKDHPIMKERFLREARVAAQLTHPSIIPIFSIDPSPEKTYYTMPYVEGETLKQILKQSYEEEREGEVLHPIGSSILALTRVFLSVCEAIAYTHSKGIVHRDLKPDNIIVGKYGEVLLLDWGLADFIGKTESFAEEEDEEADYKDLTRPGKVPGTLNYIAPERVRGEPSQAGTDIYSLGVILYQLLTLRVPFHRVSVKNFRKSMHLEKLTDPVEVAPYRDIPQHLADIAKHCLCYAPEDRFKTVDEIIAELKSFLEGKPEWIPVAELNPARKQDWEFQENVLLAKHTAITRSPEVMEWVSLMISCASFSGNTKIETRIKVSRESQGVGLLLGVPDAPERKEFSEGYCVWIGKECRLFHNNVEVMAVLDSLIDDNVFHDICIEKVDNHLFLFIDRKKVWHYISHIPLAGTHLGILCRDADFEIDPLKVMVGSQNVMVNCLAVPDAFLANKNYTKALLEYRRIASSFTGRSEGREAIFRAGITLLEEASSARKKEDRERLYLLALEEFSKLRYTPASPLEYLGKSLVYKATGEIEEEIKCLELCMRKYPKHPMLRLIREHITFRLHETSSRQRVAAYHFALLALRHLPQIFRSEDHARLISSLKRHIEKLPFFLLAEPAEEYLAMQLAFWLCKPITLVEMIETSRSSSIIANALYALLVMGRSEWVEENLHYLEDEKEIPLVRIALLYYKKGAKAALEALTKQLCASPSNSEMRCALFLFDRALLDGKSAESLPYFQRFPNTPSLDSLHIASCLQANAWKKAQGILEPYSPEILGDEYAPLFVPMGCYLVQSEGEQIALSHFGGSIDLPHPPTPMLLSYYLRGKIGEKKGWISTAFPWEKIALFRQLSLYYHCAKKTEKAQEFLKRVKLQLKKLATA